MKLETYLEGDVTIFTFTGELDTFNLQPVSKQIDGTIEAGRTRIVFDLRLMTFINSSALGYLIRARKTAKAAGGDAVLASPSQFVRRLIATVGIEKLFRIFENSDEAVRYLEGQKSAKQEKIGGAEADQSMVSPNTLIATVPMHDRPRKLVCKLHSLYAYGVKFRWEIPAVGTPDQAIHSVNVDRHLTAGAPVKVKFRQPFLEQNRYFDLESTIALVTKTTSADGKPEAEITVHFKDTETEDLKLIQKFVKELDALRNELKPNS
jgi:anti-anti-sigma factor